jgi:general secretion pathway protein I
MRRLRINTQASSRAKRSGLSLLEVVLSITIFVGAVTALSQLSTNGMTAAIQGRLNTQAILRCESKLAEVSAAIEPLEDIADQPFQDDENWTWTLATSGGPHADVLFVTVTVNYNGQSDLSSTSYSLSKLTRDPAVFEDSLEEDAP